MSHKLTAKKVNAFIDSETTRDRYHKYLDLADALAVKGEDPDITAMRRMIDSPKLTEATKDSIRLSLDTVQENPIDLEETLDILRQNGDLLQVIAKGMGKLVGDDVHSKANTFAKSIDSTTKAIFPILADDSVDFTEWKRQAIDEAAMEKNIQAEIDADA